MDVEQAVVGKVGMEREAEQALLAVGVDLCGQVEKWRREELAGGQVEDPDEAGLLEDEQPPGIPPGGRPRTAAGSGRWRPALRRSR
jgi:hypothetical protein